MAPSFGRPLSTSPSTESPGVVRRAAAVAALLAAGVWLGGLVALGAIAAPVVFAVAPYPKSADAMTIVFQRFDLLAMACAATAIAAEAARVVARLRSTVFDRLRAGLVLVASALAVFQGENVSPRIAALHAAGAVRGVGEAGVELSRLHDWAEFGGKAQVVLLAAVVTLEVLALSAGGRTLRRTRPSGPDIVE